MKYKCYYKGKDFDHAEQIKASAPEEACKNFELLMEKKEITPERYVKVERGMGFLVDESYTFESIRWLPVGEKKREEEEKKREEELEALRGRAEYLKGISFLEIAAEKRDEVYGIVSYLSAELEKRPLDKEETEFLKAWHQLKDREIGEQLLTKNEMSKPKSEQGKSAFSKTAWATGFAMQGMATQNTLNDIADDVSDISDSGGGFD